MYLTEFNLKLHIISNQEGKLKIRFEEQLRSYKCNKDYSSVNHLIGEDFAPFDM